MGKCGALQRAGQGQGLRATQLGIIRRDPDQSHSWSVFEYIWLKSVELVSYFESQN